jgi:hypothetical protein
MGPTAYFQLYGLPPKQWAVVLQVFGGSRSVAASATCRSAAPATVAVPFGKRPAGLRMSPAGRFVATGRGRSPSFSLRESSFKASSSLPSVLVQNAAHSDVVLFLPG